MLLVANFTRAGVRHTLSISGLRLSCSHFFLKHFCEKNQTMEHMHCVAETLRAQRVTVPIDGVMRRVSRTLWGTIVDWNPVDSMYTLDVENIGAVRLRRDELRITNIQDIDPPDFLAANRERAGFRARLAAVMAVENAAEPRLDPADLLPYRDQGAGHDGETGVAMGMPVYGPYLGVAPHAVAGSAFLPQCVIGQVVA